MTTSHLLTHRKTTSLAMTILFPRTFAVCLAAVMSASLCICSGNELEDFIKEAQETNPGVLAAKWQVEQALMKHDALNEFFDPDFYAAVGESQDNRSIPGTSDYTSLTADSFDAQLGFEVPISPGVYVSMGGAKRYLEDPDNYDKLYQTMFGICFRVPLLRDRAFKTLTIDKALAMAEYNASVSNLLNITQTLRRDIELAYIAAYENLSAYRVTQAATQRFQNLYNETRELSRLKVVPEYQIFQSQLELQIGREDEEKARVKFELSLVTLADTIGLKRKIALANDQKTLLETAAQISRLNEVTEQDACMSRGAYLQVMNNIQYARAEMDKQIEAKQDQLDLNFGISAQGEDESNPFAMNKLVTDHRVGGAITLVWRRNITYVGANARLSQYRARVNELNEKLRGVQLDIRTGMLSAEMNFKAAQNRLVLVNNGIKAAQQTLAAEQERFRLGECTSSEVTDAQKNLTTILQRQTIATADLLRARANYLFAVGYMMANARKAE